jgi:hypothetical protein
MLKKDGSGPIIRFKFLKVTIIDTYNFSKFDIWGKFFLFKK